MTVSIAESVLRCFKKFGDKVDMSVSLRKNWTILNRREPAARPVGDVQSALGNLPHPAITPHAAG